MTTTEFDKAVEQARSTKKIVEFSLAEKRERPATEDDLTAWEQEHGVALPASYRHFAKVHGCGGFVFTTVLSVLAESSYPIAPCLEQVGNDLVPIIDNQCGDYYCFPVLDGTCIDRMVFADHEIGYEATEDGRDFFQFVAEQGLQS
jgi:hypothetical protein